MAVGLAARVECIQKGRYRYCMMNRTVFGGVQLVLVMLEASEETAYLTMLNEGIRPTSLTSTSLG